MSRNPTSRLNDLPNEILLQIFHSIDTHRTERVLGHTSVDALLDDVDAFDDPEDYRAKDFLNCANALLNLALVNRKFSLLVPEVLYHSLHLDIGLFAISDNTSSRSRIVYLLRTLFERPKLAYHVRELCVCINHDVLSLVEAWQSGGKGSNRYLNLNAAESVCIDFIMEHARSTFKALRLPHYAFCKWEELLTKDFVQAILGILLVLLPQLATLTINNLAINPGEPIANKQLCAWYYTGVYPWNDYGGIYEQWEPFETALFNLAPKYLKLSRLFPTNYFGLQHFSSLQVLDISGKLSRLDQSLFQLLGFESVIDGSALHRVKRLRIDCQSSTVGVWSQQAQVCLSDMLRAFRHLNSLDFYAEPSAEKNPYKSVRAFPHYQSNIQAYPDTLTEVGLNTSIQTWDQRLYDARTEFTDYQHLVDSLHHMRSDLETLRLPGGFWSLPGGARKSLPRFAQFERLTRLTVPQVAIISLKLDNMVPLDESKGDFVLSPIDALPPRIEHLTIFDADVSLLKSIWLVTLLVEQSSHRRWPDLQVVKLLFGPLCTDEELHALKARKLFVPFWSLVDKAGLKLVISRDDNVPMLDY